MSVEFQIDICQVDVDMEFQDDDWGALKVQQIGVNFGNSGILVLASLFQPQGVYHSLHLPGSLNADHPWSEVIESQQKGGGDLAGDVNKDGLCSAMCLVFLLPLPTTMQAYSINDVHPMFSMRDQVTMALTVALGHVWDLIEVVPQPEESLETIYAWVEDWDKTWASICSWWRYINDNGISISKVHNECMHDYTKESAMCQNLLVLGAIAIADLQHPVEQRWIHINDIFEDYQERVELRVQLEAERLTREPSMCMHRQAAMAIGEGQGCMPSNTGAGESLRGTGGQGRQQMDSTGKGKGKEKATDEVDELGNDKGNHPPNPDPLKTGALAPKANLPCRECTKADAECEGLPGELCKQCRQAKQKCSRSLRVGRKHKNAGSGEMAAGPSHKWTKSVTVMTKTPAMTGLKLRIPACKPPPRQNFKLTPGHPTSHANNLGDLGNSRLFGRLTGLLDDPPTPDISVQDLSKVPPVEGTLLVANPGDTTTCKALAECIQLLENRADDEEFELTQIHQMLGLLAICVFGYFEQNYH
ncbi:hypothetical protein F5J12DRAFT_786298 [Pisolithus orientalis]|uniref:uncharacterized protein n=1 Tax=Pisolithus orientalis TaxID=936130 RepID=UPI00222550AB|nr:uncharacterized protein F5J12DRAFT_786298 [Pisolithus orientalis]KAI5991755.1 hypothetical protein F5J12DRAFT_786298 [Pisolithus orientalis]